MGTKLIDTWQHLVGEPWQIYAECDPYHEHRLHRAAREELNDSTRRGLTHEAEALLSDYGVVIAAGDILQMEDRPHRQWDPGDARRKLEPLIQQHTEVDVGQHRTARGETNEPSV